MSFNLKNCLDVTYTLPSLMMSFFFVSGSTRTTQMGVPTRSVPSMMSHPTMMATGE